MTTHHDYALGIAHDDRTGAMLAFVSADTFAAFYFHARQSSEQVRDATSPFDHDIPARLTTYRLSLDGRSGYAVRYDGELIYVFSTVKGRGDALVADAVRVCRANRLDCFDGYLPTLYGRHGFTETRREPNWTPGGPDVVYMSR